MGTQTMVLILGGFRPRDPALKTINKIKNLVFFFVQKNIAGIPMGVGK